MVRNIWAGRSSPGGRTDRPVADRSARETETVDVDVFKHLPAHELAAGTTPWQAAVGIKRTEVEIRPPRSSSTPRPLLSRRSVPVEQRTQLQDRRTSGKREDSGAVDAADAQSDRGGCDTFSWNEHDTCAYARHGSSSLLFIPTNQAESAYDSRRSRHAQHPEQVEHDPCRLQRQLRPFMLYYDI